MNDYWIELEAEDFIIEKMNKTLQHCQAINNWAIEEFKDFWLHEKRTPYFNIISHSVTSYIRKNNVYTTQRFTLNKAVEQALRDFKSYLVIEGDDVKLTIPETVAINEFKIAPRKIWIKSIEDSGFIKTYYGRLHFTGQWLGLIGNQLSEKHITFGMLPYLWHSISIKKEEDNLWFAQINFHDLESYQGKRGRKEYKLTLKKGKKK